MSALEACGRCRSGAFRHARRGKGLASDGTALSEEADMKAFTCTLVTILTLVWSSAAVAIDLTFDDVLSFGNPLVTMLDTHGYRFTGSFRTIDTAGSALVSNGSAVYLGQEASGPGITVTRTDGRPFLLYEFDAAGLYVP